jgi:hypothetical protein
MNWVTERKFVDRGTDGQASIGVIHEEFSARSNMLGHHRGFVGMENQFVSLAEAIGSRCEVKHVRRPSAPLRNLP